MTSAAPVMTTNTSATVINLQQLTLEQLISMKRQTEQQSDLIARIIREKIKQKVGKL